MINKWEYKEQEPERLSKDSYCCKYKNQRNIHALEFTDEKVYDGKVMGCFVALFEKQLKLHHSLNKLNYIMIIYILL
jgi:hypothetical protein